MEEPVYYRLKVGQFVWPEKLELVDAIKIVERLRSCMYGVYLERVQ